jgi:hypothetical protein
MAFPSTTNVDGSNPGPNSVNLPDTVQMPTGNVWKDGVFQLTLSPSSVANGTSAEQTFTFTGMLATDYVAVNKPTAQAGLGIVGSRAGAGFLGITFGNFTAATITPTSAEVYTVLVMRVQPNWTAPATGALMDY